uniref:Uncharacterized protein n=1 Tax=Musa acuminata subsp. malaccensis TaxID=214687 RepID=A0A804KMA3_MUSAM
MARRPASSSLPSRRSRKQLASSMTPSAHLTVPLPPRPLLRRFLDSCRTRAPRRGSFARPPSGWSTAPRPRRSPVPPSLSLSFLLLLVSSLLSIAVEEKGQRILLLVCLNILPVWLLLLLVASGVVKLPFDLPFWNDLIS